MPAFTRHPICWPLIIITRDIPVLRSKNAKPSPFFYWFSVSSCSVCTNIVSHHKPFLFPLMPAFTRHPICWPLIINTGDIPVLRSEKHDAATIFYWFSVCSCSVCENIVSDHEPFLFPWMPASTFRVSAKSCHSVQAESRAGLKGEPQSHYYAKYSGGVMFFDPKTRISLEYVIRIQHLGCLREAVTQYKLI